MKATALLCLLFTISALSAVPMAGTYVIGGESCDFFTLQGAIDTLETLGAGDDVTFELSPGTYEGPFVLNQGANGHQLVISSGFNTASEVVFTNPNATSTENYIFYLNGTDNVYFDDMMFTPTGTYTRCIVVYGDADNLIFRNNFFMYESVTSWNSEAIFFNANGSADADNITIEANSFVSGGYHIYLNSSSTLTHYTGWTVRYNSHLGGYCGVSLTSAINVTLVGESMQDVNTGIYMSGCSGDLLLTNNRINAYAAGMSLSYVTAYTSDTPHIYNNVICVNGYNWYGGYGSVDANGLNLSNCTHVYVAHNSVQNTSAATSSLAGSVSGTGNIVRKNQFVSLGGGAGYYAYNVGSTGTNIVEYNNIYSRSANIGRSMNTVYHEIDDFNALCDGVNLDFQPFFIDDTLHTVAPRLNNFGPACNVTVDFDGNPRSSTAPDLGAFEYDPDPTMTPLEGELTVGAGADYATLGNLAYALAFRGVNSHITAVLTDSLYEEQFTMERIPGIGYDRVLTITAPEGQHPVIRYSGQTSANNYVMDVYRTQYVIWRNLNFQTTATGYSNLVRLNGLVMHSQFDNCEFHAPLSSGSSANATSLGSTDYAAISGLGVLGCDFYGNSVGVGLSGTDVTVGSCYLQDQYIGISGYLLANSYIAGNGLVNSSYWGMITNGGSNLRVLSNSITGSGNGMSIENCTAGAERTLIANNIIRLTGNGTGIQMSGTDIDVLCNSVWAQGTNSRGLYCYYFPTNCTVQNNIFATPDGLAMEAYYYTPSDDKVMDYNCYYTESNSLLRVSTTYADLAALQVALPEWNAHSVALYPMFTEDMHTGCPWLREAGVSNDRVTTDYDGNLRTPFSDIGADQQTGAFTASRMHGSYTVGATDSNYPTIEAFIEALQFNGINADVTAYIQTGVYPGFYTLRDVPRTAADQTVTFFGLANVSLAVDPVNDYGNENYAFRLLGADNITMAFLNMTVLPGTHSAYLVTTTGKCDNLRFAYCDFSLIGNYDYAISTGSSTSNGLELSHCAFNGGGYGLELNGQSSRPYRGILINGCTSQNNHYPLTLVNAADLEMHDNTFQQFYKAFTLSGISDSLAIYNNRLYAGGYSSSYSVICASISGANAPAMGDMKLYDNILYLTNSQCSSATGLYLNASSNLYLNHNTIVMENQNSQESTHAFSLSSCSNCFFTNNIFSAPLSGLALNTSGCTNLVFHCNAYYANGQYLGRYENVYYGIDDLLNGQLGESTNQFANPLPDSRGYTTADYLRGRGNITPLTVDIDGNTFEGNSDPGATVIPSLGGRITADITVGPSGDYADMDTALLDITRRGISAPVNLLVQPGTYTVHSTLTHIPGAWNPDDLTIMPAGDEAPVFTHNATGTADNYILRLQGAFGLTVRGISFAPQGTGFTTCIALERFNRMNTVTGCHFALTGPGQFSQYCSAVYGYGVPMQYINVTDCDFTNFAYGVYLYGASASRAANSNVNIAGNTISNAYIGMMLNYLAGPVVTANTITGFMSSGVYMTYANNAEISANHLTGNGSYGINLTDFVAGTDSQLVCNNYVEIGGSPMACLHLRNVPNAGVFFNTLVNTSAYSSGNAFQQEHNCPGLAFANNLCQGGVYSAAQFYQLSDIARLDHNLYHVPGTCVVRVGSSSANTVAAYATLTGDDTSLFADPLLGETYHTLAGSPAIDGGVAIAGIDEDIEGNTRTAPDMGCWEYSAQMLDAPQNVRLSVSGNVATLSWNAVTGATMYRVYQSATYPATEWTIQDVTGTTVQIPTSSGYRYFRVSALDGR